MFNIVVPARKQYMVPPWLYITFPDMVLLLIVVFTAPPDWYNPWKMQTEATPEVPIIVPVTVFPEIAEVAGEAVFNTPVNVPVVAVK